MKEVVAGFDPGGQGNFGWCVVARDTMCVIGKGVADYAKHAFDCALRVAEKNAPFVAAGIDAPLYWTLKGDSRKADDYVRRNSGASSGTVQAVNSLRGACLIQGFFLAQMIESAYPNCVITETHPKALMKNSETAREFGCANANNEHERDALISAWAAMQSLGGSGRNLFCCEDKKEIHSFLKKTVYWWPN